MAIIIPSKNIYKKQHSKPFEKKIDYVSAELYDTDIKEHTIKTTWDGSDSLLSNEVFERSAKIKKIKITPSVTFYSLDAKGEKIEVPPEYYTNFYPDKTPKIPTQVTIENPVVSDDLTYYTIFGQSIITATNVFWIDLKFALTNNFRAKTEIFYDAGHPNIIFMMLESLDLEITVEGVRKDFGTTVKVYSENGEVSNQENKRVFSLETNELMQTTNVTPSGSNFNEYLAKEIASNYKNGKETATILCSISDYFDEKGKKSIDASGLDRNKRMTFSLGNIVIPMFFDAYSKCDVPISSKNDGTPKKFCVVQRKMIYDGAVWQELTLQEV